MARPIKDLTGQKFGILTVIKFDSLRPGGAHWLCKCECGNEKVIRGNKMKEGEVKGCGCLVKRGNYFRHGETHTKFYQAWRNIKKRCNNVNREGYKNWGGRGIKYCSEWEDYLTFKQDMYEEYLNHLKVHGAKQTSLDREKNELGYSKPNCRWVTQSVQQNNRRKQTKK